MPRGRPAKSKRGHTTSEELDPKLPNRKRNLILKRLQNEKRKKFEKKYLKEDIEENERNKTEVVKNSSSISSSTKRRSRKGKSKQPKIVSRYSITY